MHKVWKGRKKPQLFADNMNFYLECWGESIDKLIEITGEIYKVTCKINAWKPITFLYTSNN